MTEVVAEAIWRPIVDTWVQQFADATPEEQGWACGEMGERYGAEAAASLKDRLTATAKIEAKAVEITERLEAQPEAQAQTVAPPKGWAAELDAIRGREQCFEAGLRSLPMEGQRTGRLRRR